MLNPFLSLLHVLLGLFPGNPENPLDPHTEPSSSGQTCTPGENGCGMDPNG